MHRLTSIARNQTMYNPKPIIDALQKGDADLAQRMATGRVMCGPTLENRKSRAAEIMVALKKAGYNIQIETD